MTNFDFLLSDADFAPFAQAAVAAEQIYQIDPAACILYCRRAMEAAVKWMYSVDGCLTLPVDNRLAALMDSGDFRGIVGEDVWKRMKLVRVLGNQAAHGGKKLTREQAAVCLENLYIFLDQTAYFYAKDYTEGKFDPSLSDTKPEPAPAPVPEVTVELERLMEENRSLRTQLTARREEQQPTYVPKPLELTEYQTRKIYIDAMLLDAGWTEGKDWLNEVELPGMPNKSGVGYADYVLYGDNGKPLAVIEAKRTCADVSKGRQ